MSCHAIQGWSLQWIDWSDELGKATLLFGRGEPNGALAGEVAFSYPRLSLRLIR